MYGDVCLLYLVVQLVSTCDLWLNRCYLRYISLCTKCMQQYCLKTYIWITFLVKKYVFLSSFHNHVIAHLFFAVFIVSIHEHLTSHMYSTEMFWQRLMLIAGGVIDTALSSFMCHWHCLVKLHVSLTLPSQDSCVIGTA